MIIIIIIAIIIATEAITEIIVSSVLLEPLRDRLKKFKKWPWSWLAYLIHCGYCSSVWVSFILVLPLPRIDILPIFFDVCIKAMVVHRMSNLVHELFKRWFDRHPISIVLHRIGDRK